jgi:hypothetical protein
MCNNIGYQDIVFGEVDVKRKTIKLFAGKVRSLKYQKNLLIF